MSTLKPILTYENLGSIHRDALVLPSKNSSNIAILESQNLPKRNKNNHMSHGAFQLYRVFCCCHNVSNVRDLRNQVLLWLSIEHPNDIHPLFVGIPEEPSYMESYKGFNWLKHKRAILEYIDK